MLCSVLVIFTAAIFVVTLAQNIVFRTADIYLFYFNDSRAVDQIYTTWTTVRWQMKLQRS